MGNNVPQTLKGFRDFLPAGARKRGYVISVIKNVFERFGFEPLETPALEYESVLLGKYGEEGDKLMYRFEDLGKRKVALRYDQTVPLARVIAQYQNELPMPFKRYQIQPVWRAENTQKGRFREFLQCDADIVGTTSILADVEVIQVAVDTLSKLGFKNLKVLVNDRRIFSDFVEKKLLSQRNIAIFVRAIDKLKKVGREKVLDELVRNGISTEVATYALQTLESQASTPYILKLFEQLKTLGVDQNICAFDPTLARGLDYYTSLIFEIEIEGYDGGSVAGGGRYDKLIGMFAGRDIPAVGFAFGFDRIVEALDALGIKQEDSKKTVLVTIFSPELKNASIALVKKLRENDIDCELYLDEAAKLDKQLKYADKKGIPYVVILGPEEVKNNVVLLKDMKTGKQETLSIEQLINRLQ